MKYKIRLKGVLFWIVLVFVAGFTIQAFKHMVSPVVSADLALATVNGTAINYAAQRQWQSMNGLSGFILFLFGAATLWPCCVQVIKSENAN